jgi:hypothetical protein
VEPSEALSEGLEATLLEWKSSASPVDRAFSVPLREEGAEGWAVVSSPQTRLVPRHWAHWQSLMPGNDPAARCLEGELLRFVFP